MTVAVVDLPHVEQEVVYYCVCVDFSCTYKRLQIAQCVYKRTTRLASDFFLYIVSCSIPLMQTLCRSMLQTHTNHKVSE